MANRATYKAARIIATTVEDHFAHHIAEALAIGEQRLAPAPTAMEIERLVDVAFWASLRREEGNSPKVSLAFLPPEMADIPLLFEEKLPLTATVLAKLSPGIERPGIHLGVWHNNGDLYIWGAMHGIRTLCLVLDVSEPGLLVIKHRRMAGFGKFVNLAVLKGDQIKIVDESSVNLPDCPDLLTSLLGFTSPAAWNDSVNILVQLAVSMRAHHHGGTLLIVPSKSNAWRESVVHPITYTVAPAFSGLADLVQQNIKEKNESQWQISLRREVDSLAGLTAIDGATIVNDKYELIAFGAKITRPATASLVERIVFTEPIVGSKAEIIHPTLYGGTRHLSAAQFIHDQKNALALVASQDGRFTIFSWSPCEGMVHAHRVDALLL
ncbi:MAG: putative sensor domain DACNV-containing protein [Bacteroidia bacterium]